MWGAFALQQILAHLILWVLDGLDQSLWTTGSEEKTTVFKTVRWYTVFRISENDKTCTHNMKQMENETSQVFKEVSAFQD